MQAQSRSGTDPGMIRLYQSISTILRNRSKPLQNEKAGVVSKSYFIKEERGGLFQFEGLVYPVPFLNNLINLGVISFIFSYNIQLFINF